MTSLSVNIMTVTPNDMINHRIDVSSVEHVTVTTTSITNMAITSLQNTKSITANQRITYTMEHVTVTITCIHGTGYYIFTANQRITYTMEQVTVTITFIHETGYKI